MTAGDEVLFDVADGVAVMTLNRPRALNALTLPMVRAIDGRLAEWARDPSVRAVVIRGAGDRAFCAGGDVRALYDERQQGGTLRADFFREEYRLNRRIFRYPKPYVALMDGITMGGGVGLSVHGSQRVASERTVVAMPETGIGLFPDVGGSYFLPRCPGRTGLYIALTGARLDAADCIHARLADHIVPSDRHDDVIAALRAGEEPESAIRRLADVVGESRLADDQEAIENCFAGDSLQAVLDALRLDGSDWATEAATAISTKSPTSLHITFRELQEGTKLEFEACLVMEYRLSQHVMAGHDFYEGVRALLVDKDGTPRWRPELLEEVDDAMVEGYFAPLGTDDLTFPEH